MKKLLLIINPCAGQKKAKKQLTEIIDIFNRADFAVITHITSGSGDAEAACIRFADQVDQIVCCGGDGTFNETVSGVLKSGKDIPIGYIPAGSTNDFASSLRLSGDLLQAARDIAEGQPKRLDIGLFGDRYFSYVASFGAFTRASYATPQNVKNTLGHLAYVLEGIKDLSKIRPHHVRFELEDGEVIEDDFIFGAISNSTSVGGILTLDPKTVDMNDGLFELLLVKMPKSVPELNDCIRMLTEQVYTPPVITFRSASRLTVTAAPDMEWSLDGEWGSGSAQIAVQNLHDAIRLVK